MPYTPVHSNWENLPSTATPVNAAALKHIEDGIAAAAATADAAVKFTDLGTAATSQATDFASHAQGLLAETALQPGGADLPGDFGKLFAALANRNGAAIPIVFAGSSTIAGNGASQADRAFPAVVTSTLQAAYPLRSGSAQPAYRTLDAAVAALPLAVGIQGVNAGVAGTTAANFLDSTSIAKIAQIAPKIVGIQVGSNDYLGNVLPATYKANVESKLAALRTAIPGTPIFVLIHQYRRGDAISPTYAWELYGQALKQIADAAADCVFVNTQPYFDAAGVPTPDSYALLADTVHPNDAGHAMIADIVLRALGVPMVGSAATPATGQRTILSDDFTRADGAPGTAPTGQTYTVVGSSTIATNRLSFAGQGTVTAQVDLRNLEIEATLVWNISSVGLVFRSDSNANRLGVFIQSGQVVFYRTVGSTSTSVAQAAFTTTAGGVYFMRLRVNNSTVQVWINGTLVTTFTIDSTSDSATAGLTRAGVRSGAAGNFIDDFAVRTYS